MKIGELGRLTGVSAKTIRFYEAEGLLPEPPRTATGYRDYGEDAAARLRFVRDAQATGLSLAEIGSILDMRDRGEQTCTHVIGLLDRHLEEIDRQIERLRSTRALLTELAERAKTLDPAGCIDPNRCQTIAGDAGDGLSELGPHHVHGAPARHEDHA
jgi:DNA-binding transcriptional MerR regulator